MAAGNVILLEVRTNKTTQALYVPSVSYWEMVMTNENVKAEYFADISY